MPDQSEAELEAQLHKAHERHDGAALARLYAEAARLSANAGRTDEASYRRTQAYVFALECGNETLAAEMRQMLVSEGREE